LTTFLVALVGGVVGSAVGALAGASAGALIAAATGMSNFEGAAGYFAVVACAPVGALVGLLAGVWVALRLRGGPRSLAAVAAYSGLTLGTVVAAGAGVVALVLLLDDTLDRNAAKPQALFEIRLPPASTLADDRRAIEVELDTDRNGASAFFHDEWRHDGDRPVISGGVELAIRTTQRILVLKIRGEPDRLFRLNLSGKPGHSDEFGPWQPVDFVADGGPQPRRATAADQYEIRYRPRDPNVEFSRPIVAFELSLPAATGLPTDLGSITVEAQEAQNTMEGAIDADPVARRDGRVTLGGTVQLAGDRHSLLAITLPGQPTRLFELTLPPLTWVTETIRQATTSPANDRRSFGPWQPVALVRDVGQKEARPATPEDDARLRYRLR
jgi:hypothetical protein